MAKRKSGPAGMTATIGGALVDLEQAILRARPTVEERYERRDEVTIVATDGGELTIGLPARVTDQPEAQPAVESTTGRTLRYLGPSI